MIIGNGDIASVLPDRNDLLFFASGVSNSQEEREDEYLREYEMLISRGASEHIVYFSSLSIFYSNNRYAKHKRQMEKAVKNFPRYTIVRIGNITWGDNPNTFINAYNLAILKGELFFIKDEYRYVVDKEEFLHWINLIPSWNCEINIPGKRMKVKEVIEIYGHFK